MIDVNGVALLVKEAAIQIGKYQDERLTEATIRWHGQHEQGAEDLELSSTKEEYEVRNKAKVRSALRSLLAAVNISLSTSLQLSWLKCIRPIVLGWFECNRGFNAIGVPSSDCKPEFCLTGEHLLGVSNKGAPFRLAGRCRMLLRRSGHLVCRQLFRYRRQVALGWQWW